MSRRKRKFTGPSWEQIKADALARGGVLCKLRIEFKVTSRNQTERALGDHLLVKRAHKEWKEETGRTEPRKGFGYPY